MFYSLACTDGGFTGRSLSLVSHYVHDTSKPFKLQSVSVKGVWQAAEFASMLYSNPAVDHGVRHLFISCLHPHDNVTSHVEDMIEPSQGKRHSGGASEAGFLGALVSRLSPTSAQLKRRAVETRRKKVIRAAQKGRPFVYRSTQCLLQDSLLQMLSLVAGTLITLSLSVPFDYTKRGLPPIIPKLPLLTELTISYLMSWPIDGLSDIFEKFPPLPALKRLNLAGIEVRVPILALFDGITARAPCLSHLFLSTPRYEGARAAALSLLAFGTLEQAGMGGTLANHIHPGLSTLAGQAKTPASLSRIFMQEGARNASWHQLYKFIAHYEERLVFIPLEGEGDPIDRHRGELEVQWVDRMNGGEGCWGAKAGPDRMSLTE
jgi:hypothetical protein